MTVKTVLERKTSASKCRVVVIWIDWYPYHVARFNGLQAAASQEGVAGIELVGGVGVHAGLSFREDLGSGTDVETLRPKANWHNVSKVGLSLSLLKALSRLDPEVVLVPGYYTLPAFAAMLWARAKGRTCVLMTETTAADHLRIAWREKLKSKLICTMFDWALTGGSAHVRYLQQLGFPTERIARFYDVVGNERMRANVDLLRERSSAAAHALPEEYFLFVGRLAEEKNVTGLVKAWLAYRAQGGTWSLVLAGDGPERKALEDLLAESAHRDKVFLMGHKSSRELIPLFAFARCFVLPSIREPWGLVVNEAMAACLPLIVSTRCGCSEDLVVEGENGFLFDPSDQGALLNCLVRTEALPEVERQRRALSSAAKVSVYSPQHFGQEILRIAAWSDARRPAGRETHPRQRTTAERMTRLETSTPAQKVRDHA